MPAWNMAREISTSIEIETGPAAIWDILSDLSRYAEWNPFIRRVWGTATVGERIRFVFELPRGFAMKGKATILRVEPSRELRWAGGLPVRGLFRAEHYHILRRIDGNKTIFEHGESFTGLLVPLVWPFLRRKGPQVYVDTNYALKERVESLGPGPGAAG